MMRPAEALTVYLGECGLALDERYVQEALHTPAQALMECDVSHIDIFVKHTGQEPDRIEQDMDRDIFFTPQAAAGYGLIDRVLEGARGG